MIFCFGLGAGDGDGGEGGHAEGHTEVFQGTGFPKQIQTHRRMKQHIIISTPNLILFQPHLQDCIVKTLRFSHFLYQG